MIVDPNGVSYTDEYIFEHGTGCFNTTMFDIYVAPIKLAINGIQWLIDDWNRV